MNIGYVSDTRTGTYKHALIPLGHSPCTVTEELVKGESASNGVNLDLMPHHPMWP